MNPQCVPFIQVSDLHKSESFYCGQLGFQKEWSYQPEPHLPSFASLRRENIRLFLTEHPESAFGLLVYCYMEDVDRFHQEITDRGVEPEWTPIDTDWQTREMQLRDPDGNKLRFGTPL